MPVVFTGYASVANRTVVGESNNWNTAHDAASGSILTNYDTPNFYIIAGSYMSGGSHFIYRGLLDFDTSSISPGADITSGTLKLYVTFLSSGVNVSNPIHVTQGVQDIPVVGTNYGDQLAETTSGGSQSSMPLNAYRTITLNAAGLALINKGGITKLCIRGDVDLGDENPSSTYNNYIYFYSAQKGGDYRPLLTLNYDYYPGQYPSDSVARVSSIRHICRPGFYRMQVGVGDLGFDIDVAEATVRKALDTAKEAEPPPPMREPQLPGRLPPRTGIIKPEPPRPPITIGPVPPDYVPPAERLQQAEPSLWSKITPWKEELGETFPSEVAERWRALTPWKEEEGETFGSEVMERVRAVTRFFGGLFR